MMTSDPKRGAVRGVDRPEREGGADAWLGLIEDAIQPTPISRLQWREGESLVTRSKLNASDAHRARLSCLVRARDGWVLIDGDARGDTLAAVARAGELLGITVGGSPSGSAGAEGLHVTLIAHPGTPAHVEAFAQLVHHFVGWGRVVRVGQPTRCPGGATYKPWHDDRQVANAVVIGIGGVTASTTPEELRIGLQVTSSVPVDNLPTLLLDAGVPASLPRGAGAVRRSSGEQSRRTHGVTPRAMLESLNRHKRRVALSDGSGVGGDGTRSVGQYRVVVDLFDHGFSDADVEAFLDAFPIGQRPCDVAWMRACWEGRLSLAAGMVGQSGPALAAPRAIAERVWRMAVTSPTGLLGLAVLCDAVGRVGCVEVGLSRRQAAEATGAAGTSLFRALRSTAGVVEVQSGELDKATVWRLDPEALVDTPEVPCRPTVETVLLLGRSDLAQARLLWARRPAASYVTDEERAAGDFGVNVLRPGPLLALAAIMDGARTREQVATGIGVPVATAKGWIQEAPPPRRPQAA